MAESATCVCHFLSLQLFLGLCSSSTLFARMAGVPHGLEQGLEVSTAQEELVRLNLLVKSLNSSFEGVSGHREMTQLNAEVRRQMEAMRRLLKVLRDLANRQKDPDLVKMLMNDVENHNDQITSLQVRRLNSGDIFL